MTRGALVLGVALSAVGCASARPIAGVGELAGDWHGRRAAYSAIIGFAILMLTLGAGLFLPGKHGG